MAQWLAGLGFHSPSLSQSNDALRINRDFLATLGLRWWDPESLPDGCFSNSAAAGAQAEIGALLDQFVDAGGDVLLQDASLARLGPLWLEEFKARFEPVVIVRVLGRADAAFQAFSQGVREDVAQSPAITCRAQSDLLWLHCNMELERWSRGERRLLVVCDELAQSPDEAGRRLRLALGQALGRALREIDPPAGPLLPKATGLLPSDRDRVLERIYQALSGQAEDAKDCLEAAWAQLQARVPAAHQAFDASLNIDLFHEAHLQRFVSLCEYRPQFPNASPVRRVADRMARRVWRSRKPRPADPPFLFISGNPAARSHLYRVRNPMDGLRRLGAPACWMSAKMLGRCDVKRINARCVILHRCAEDEAIDALIHWCRRRGMPIGYDIDDFVFDAEIMREGGIHFIARLPESEQDAWFEGARGHWRLMAAADFCLTPTKTLAEQARRANPQVRVIENGFGPETLALSEFWRSRGLRDGDPRVGYASGTATHEADFATIARPLAQALRQQPNLGFTLVGSLDLAPYEDLLPASRLERRPLVEHVNLAHELARFDINLIPLQASPFCDAKSPLKYFEAALVGIPSIAVANPTYHELIQHGENGLLAHSQDEWAEHIALLASDADLRARQAAVARKDCVARFHADRLAEKYLQLT
ncbi:MAG: glycosyltransferase family 4 protein [Gammaproteobacteria bacterium]|nr:glycosyltransferase family 4 protein [Gammaproteobacteria bacterium]